MVHGTNGRRGQRESGILPNRESRKRRAPRHGHGRKAVLVLQGDRRRRPPHNAPSFHVHPLSLSFFHSAPALADVPFCITIEKSLCPSCAQTAKEKNELPRREVRARLRARTVCAAGRRWCGGNSWTGACAFPPNSTGLSLYRAESRMSLSNQSVRTW